MLLQTDGSRHDWLEERGPRLTLVAAIDDVTGIVTGATFREQEDAAGYLAVLRDTIRRHGVPLAPVCRRGPGSGSRRPRSLPLTLEEQLVDRRSPTQFGKALAELGITSIAARSPQAKDRTERAWTFQDRPVVELRLAAAADIEAANRVLGRFVTRFNRRFAVPAADPRPAWRALQAEVSLDAVCCLKYRLVAHDQTIMAGSTILQLPPVPGQRGYAGKRVEPQLRLDGRLVSAMASASSRRSRHRPIRAGSAVSTPPRRGCTRQRRAHATIPGAGSVGERSSTSRSRRND